MALTAPEAPPARMTYEDYMAEGEVFKRYDIIDGVRIFMTNPTRLHQDYLLNLGELLRQYQRLMKSGRTYIAPCDVLIRRDPLRTRQPDVLFISHEQPKKCAPRDNPTPLEATPELVIEILSPSETRRARLEKLRDYASIGVKECWIVSPQAETVEVLTLTGEGLERIGIYGAGQEVSSTSLPGLVVKVDDVFAE
jgi:Uma2 family endonuclease